MDKLFEMINQDFKAQGTKFQVLLEFWICCREPGRLKLWFFAHACTVSVLSGRTGNGPLRRVAESMVDMATVY